MTAVEIYLTIFKVYLALSIAKPFRHNSETNEKIVPDLDFELLDSMKNH